METLSDKLEVLNVNQITISSLKIMAVQLQVSQLIVTFMTRVGSLVDSLDLKVVGSMPACSYVVTRTQCSNVCFPRLLVKIEKT